MSELLVGFDMPPDRAVFLAIDNGVVYAKTLQMKDWKRLENVSVHHVPPHGRLIDADALIADIKRQCREVFRVDAVSPDDFWIARNEAYNERLWGTWCESFFGYLQTRPTIIEAEDGEE